MSSRVDVERGAVVAEIVVLEIDAQQRGVGDRAGVELRLQLVVDRDRFQLGFADIADARHSGAVVDQADAVHQLRLVIEIGIACVLPHGEDVVEPVLEQVADRELVEHVSVEVRFADEGMARDVAVRIVEHRAGRRQELDPPSRASSC